MASAPVAEAADKVIAQRQSLLQYQLQFVSVQD